MLVHRILLLYLSGGSMVKCSWFVGLRFGLKLDLKLLIFFMRSILNAAGAQSL